jgi:hypothetical protein
MSDNASQSEVIRDNGTWAEVSAYVSGVGMVAHAWNALHEELGRLFIVVVKPAQTRVASAVWYSPFSDRAQRDMLLAAIDKSDDLLFGKLPPSAKEDMIWALKTINKLGDMRDNAIHAPISLYDNGSNSEMAASFLSGHRRAKNLAGKQILVEFDWCKRYAERMTAFIQHTRHAMMLNGDALWPDRPAASDRRPKKAILSPHLRSRREQHPPPPRSSPP